MEASPSMDRRALFGAAALLALATPARAADSGPDAALIALCAEFDALERQFLATDFNADTAEDERDRIAEAQTPLVERIAGLRAVTLAGHVARARSLALWDADLLAGPAADMGEVLAAALVRDLLAGSAGA